MWEIGNGEMMRKKKECKRKERLELGEREKAVGGRGGEMDEWREGGEHMADWDSGKRMRDGERGIGSSRTSWA